MAPARDRAIDGGRTDRSDTVTEATISAASVVDISIHTCPARRPAITPSSASSTTADAAGDGKHVITTSTDSAIAFGDSAHFAPPSSNGCVASGDGSRTVRSMPLRNSDPASLPPTLPSPMKPTRTLARSNGWR